MGRFRPALGEAQPAGQEGRGPFLTLDPAEPVDVGLGFREALLC